MRKMKAYKNKEEGKIEFYKHMKEAVITSLFYLKKKAEKERINPLLNYDFKIDINKKSWSLAPKLYYPLASLVNMNIKEILKLPEVVSCINFMIKNKFHKMIEIEGAITDKDGKLVDDIETYKMFLGYEIIGTFLIKYVDIKKGFDYDEIIFNNLYNELEEYIYTEGREIIAVVPLLNFELAESERIDLGDFIIRKITEDEIKMLLGKGALGEHYFLFLRGGFFDTIWCVELKVKFPSKRKQEDLTPYIERIITALRLFKKGSVQYSAIFIYPKVWRTSWRVSGYRIREEFGPRYMLTNEDVKYFKTFWSDFKSINIQNYLFLDMAIRRFNFSYDRRLLEDKLIDFITAFEALFLKEAEGEYSYRLALRCAYFLRKNEKERKEIFEILRGAYNARSKIVHGKPIRSLNKILNKLNLRSLTELSMQVEECLRESIKLFLNYLQSKSHDEIIKEIDEKIISGG